jgi:hypothetical protein
MPDTETNETTAGATGERAPSTARLDAAAEAAYILEALRR